MPYFEPDAILLQMPCLGQSVLGGPLKKKSKKIEEVEFGL